MACVICHIIVGLTTLVLDAGCNAVQSVIRDEGLQSSNP